MHAKQESKRAIITVRVDFLGYSQDDVGVRDMTITLNPLSNLKDLLIKLAKKIGSKFISHVYDPNSNSINENITLIINGRHYTALDELETCLKSGDNISIFPPLGGG